MTNMMTSDEIDLMIEKLRTTTDNSDKIQIMESNYKRFVPSPNSTSKHIFMHALYNACSVLYERPVVSRSEMIEYLHKRNVDYDSIVIEEIIRSF